jgi:hypothetical protein
VSARFIDNVGTEIHRLWTVRASLFMFVLVGAVLSLSAFTDVFNPWFFLFLSMTGYGLIGFLRLVKQVPKADIA